MNGAEERAVRRRLYAVGIAAAAASGAVTLLGATGWARDWAASRGLPPTAWIWASLAAYVLIGYMIRLVRRGLEAAP